MARPLITALLLLCAVYAVAAQYPVALYQRQGNSTCQDFPLDTCNACTNNCGQTHYYKCENDGDHFDCWAYSDSKCQYTQSYPSVHHAECGQLGSCSIGYQQKFTVEWAVDATTTLAAYSEPHGRESYVQMSGESAVTQGHVTNVLYASGGDNVRFETVFNETTYLTSAGTCEFDQTCYAGDLAYRASLLPLANITEPTLQGTRVEIHTDGLLGFKNADSTTTSSFTALLGSELNLGSDELSEVVLEATIDGTSVVLSNLVLGREYGDAPILYFDLVTSDGLSEYDYVQCEWENRSDSSDDYWWGFGSFGSFESFYTFTFYWWDAVEDVEQLRMETATASPTPTPTPTPTPSRSQIPTASPSRSPVPQCEPVHVEPIYYDDDDQAYIHCSLDRLFWSNEFLSYAGGFDSFARVQDGPLQKLWAQLGALPDIFRL